jgi:hypothetical protein
LGNYEPFLIWQDRRNNLGAEAVMAMTGGGLANTKGAIYQPKGSEFLLSGGGSSTSTIRVITGSLDLTGGSSVTMNSSGSKPLLIPMVSLIR